ncbi:MAG TPA: DNA alkylation repair protein [Pseudonocardia sp.]|nr:DNA alkylation repair protein [Pseudonocardia sp.]
MPTADELLSADAVLGLIDCLRVAAPATKPTALRRAVAELPGQALAERARAVRDALLADLPGGFGPFAAVVHRALADPAFTGWMIWPVSEAVAALAVAPGPPHEFEAGLALLARLTSRLTGEFAIRTFLDADLDRTLSVVRGWTGHPDEHVRRLASEGTRPRLPWARRVRAITDRPAAAIELLDTLYRDESDYVRRSVANHLNDVSRLDAALATGTARRWLAEPDAHTASVVRHALRILVKAGDPDALALLGFEPPAGIVLSGFALTGSTVELGGGLGFAFSVANHGAEPARLAIDYVIHHRKANGTLAPKVFKLTTRTLDPGAAATIERTHSFRPISTRRYYPGGHAVEIQVNGTRLGRHEFLLAAP